MRHEIVNNAYCVDISIIILRKYAIHGKGVAKTWRQVHKRGGLASLLETERSTCRQILSRNIDIRL